MENTNRVLYTNSHELNKPYKFVSNYQSTTKYNLITFFPKALFIQFKRVANIYFLLIAVLQSWTVISPLNPFSAIAPLVFVIFVSMTREGVEDYLRYKSDKEINSSEVSIYQDPGFKDKTFKDIKVGDVVLIKKDCPFPADLILVTSCNESGTAYIETSTLDGEKNLKPRQSLVKTQDLTLDSNFSFVYKLECENPNPKIYHFSGSIEIQGVKYSLDKNHLLLGGAFLRNTANVIGIAIYTGKDTKLRQNLMAKTSKQSKIETRVGRFILFIISLQFLMCLCTGIGSKQFVDSEVDNHKYLNKGLDYSANVTGVLTYFTYFLLLNTMLPISLIISLELLKVFQGYFMQNDQEMYSELRDRPCKVSAYNITEELGMIQHIFSDKTGTLTCNKMEFKFCSIGNKIYGNLRFLRDLDFVTVSSYATREIIFTFDTRDISNDLFSKSHHGQKLKFRVKTGRADIITQDELVAAFTRCMALCHECLIEIEGGMIRYIGQSPDEITLVDAARHIGIEYTSILNKIITLKIKDFNRTSNEQYEKICLMEFDSDRKRNSILLKDLQTNSIILYVKGADNIIRSRLSSSNSKDYIEKINKDLLEYSNRGLRTLLLAFRYIPQEEYLRWKARYDVANTSIDNRQEKLNELAEEIERELILLGCTAVEDALQAEVPATIRSILEAGIKLWMLTGDKLETAINIGKTCGLISNETKVFTCSEGKIEELCALLSSIAEKSAKKKNSAFVIEGMSLETILFDAKDKEKLRKYPEFAEIHTQNTASMCTERFLKISQQCATIICCRVTPGQKREVVKMMKSKSKCISLAIGDGANDVSMILEADVGVGIYGEEGMQAIQASDYGLGEFKFLWELLLVHGRYNYLRVSEMILYFFYKNIVFTFPQFLFAFYCGFSGKSVYDDWYITLYNMVFTALPLMSRALFEKDVMIPKRNQIASPEEALIRAQVPKVYSLGRENQVFTIENFLLWFSTGIFHSCVVFFLPLYALEAGIIDDKGHNADFWVFSISSFTCVIFLVNFKLTLYTRIWTKIHIACIVIFSISLYLLFMLSYDFYSPTSSRGSVLQIISTPYFYMILIEVLIIAAIIDGGCYVLRRIVWPTDSEILQDYSIEYNASKSQNKRKQRLKSTEFTVSS